MPTYDYLCACCGPFETLRGMGERNLPCPCPACGAASERALLAAPRLAAMSGNARQAHETNERASHAPQTAAEYSARRAGRHPAGCGCCGSGQRSATVTTPAGAKAFPGKRPWMISH